MTEADWLAATDPMPMLEFLRGKASDRKLILFVVGVLRSSQTDRSRNRENLIRFEIAERFADSRVSISTVRETWGGQPSWPETPFACAESLLTGETIGVLLEAPPVALAHQLRDVVGNPFRPVTADPSWLTSTVAALARGIYDERAFDRLPILADALQDAGCDHADVLAHCRSDGPHARGCWVVDLLLGLS